MAVTAGLVGAGVGAGLGGALGNVIRSIVDALKEALKFIATQIARFLRWYANLIVTKPEIGITLTILIAYLLW